MSRGISKVRITDGFSNEVDLEENINNIINSESDVALDVKYLIEYDTPDEETGQTTIYHRALIQFTDGV